MIEKNGIDLSLGTVERDRKNSGLRPITYLQDLDRVRESLKDKPRDLLLFDFVTQTDVKMKDLLQMKVRDLLYLRGGDRLPTGKSKGNVSQGFIMTEGIYQTFQLYMNEIAPAKLDYLFKSRKGASPLTISTVSHLVRSWFENVNLKGVVGSRSLRKAWGLFQKKDKGIRGLGSEISSIKFLRPVKITTLQEKIYKELLHAIVSGRIRPGQKITAKRIAKHLNVSQMPVREAFGKLSSLGYISPKKTGSVVTELSKENLEEILEIRLMLEKRAVEKSCLSFDEEGLIHLKAIHNKFLRSVECNDVEGLLLINKEFHFSIYRGSNMPILIRIMEGLWDRVSPYLHIFVGGGTNHSAMVSNHSGMLHGMKHKDPEETWKWLRKDLIEAANFVMTSLK